MRCENCEFLGSVVTVSNNDECSDVDTLFYVCNKMKLTTSDGMSDKDSLIDNAPNLACVTGSGSGYENLLVEKSFFCALYKQNGTEL